MKRSKRYVVQIKINDIGLFNLEEFMSRLDCKYYFGVFHPVQNHCECCCGHYHIYVEFFEKTDFFLVEDYFEECRIIDRPKDSRRKIAAYLSRFGFYKLNVMGEEVDIKDCFTETNKE